MDSAIQPFKFPSFVTSWLAKDCAGPISIRYNVVNILFSHRTVVNILFSRYSAVNIPFSRYSVVNILFSRYSVVNILFLRYSVVNILLSQYYVVNILFSRYSVVNREVYARVRATVSSQNKPPFTSQTQSE